MDQVGQTESTDQMSSDSSLDGLVERIREAAKADLVVLYPYAYLKSQLVEPHISGEILEGSNLSIGVGRFLLRVDEPIWAKNSKQLLKILDSDLDFEKDDIETREQIDSTAAVPLRSGNEPVGVLLISYRHPQRFDGEQKNLILGLANIAAIAIKNDRRFRDLSRHRLDELQVLRQIEGVKSSLMSDVLETILKRGSEVVGSDEASIYLYNPNTRKLEIAASLNAKAGKYGRHSIQLDAKGIVPWVYHHKMPARVNNLKANPKWRGFYEKVSDATLSELDVPLIDGDTVVGVINFESTRESGFSEQDESFLVTLAAHVVLAIKTAQLYERAETGRRSLASLHEVTKQIIAQRGNPERVIRFILSQARCLIGAEGALFIQYDGEQPGEYYRDSAIEQTTTSITKRSELESSGFESGIVKHVAKTKLPHATIGIDAQHDPFHEGSPSIHSEVAVPLLSEDGELVGVLALESPRHLAFNDADERVLILFSELARIAIENARDQSRAINESAHAKQESKRFQLLWEAGLELGEITEPERLESAYNIVIAKVGEFSHGEVIIRRYDAKAEELILVAVGRQRFFPPITHIPKSEGINGYAVRELRTIWIDDLDHLPQGVAPSIANDPSIKTLVATPIIFERVYYGNLILSDERPNSLSHADISLLEGLAKQLAITLHRLEIANAKREAEQHMRNLQVIGEVGQSAMEIAHRLGNELGLVRTYVRRIQAELKAQGIESDLISDDLAKVVRDVSNVLNRLRV
jgi:GAF domain-containing protein